MIKELLTKLKIRKYKIQILRELYSKFKKNDPFISFTAISLLKCFKPNDKNFYIALQQLINEGLVKKEDRLKMKVWEQKS